MKRIKNAAQVTDIKDVDFDKFRIQRKEISINGKKLPIGIGDRIKICESDTLGRTVMGITIHEDSRVQYILEWHDPATGNFNSEALTLSELKLMSQNSYKAKKNSVGFAEGKEG